MANGQAYDPKRPTMAHRTLPFGTVVRVVRVSTGAAVIVQVADRGPFGKRRRIADLSREAARRLDMIRDGVVDVRLEVLRRNGEASSKLHRLP
jgi:rare lipoprotein A